MEGSSQENFVVDITHMPKNIQWVSPNSKIFETTPVVQEQNIDVNDVVGMIVYRRNSMTIAGHIIMAAVLFGISLNVLLNMLGVYSFAPYYSHEFDFHFGFVLLFLFSLGGGIYLAYCAAKLKTNRIKIIISKEAIDCEETYLNRRKTYHFAINGSLRLQRYVSSVGRNREYYSLYLKSDDESFPFGLLAPAGLKWLEETLKHYIDFVLLSKHKSSKKNLSNF